MHQAPRCVRYAMYEAICCNVTPRSLAVQCQSGHTHRGTNWHSTQPLGIQPSRERAGPGGNTAPLAYLMSVCLAALSGPQAACGLRLPPLHAPGPSWGTGTCTSAACGHVSNTWASLYASLPGQHCSALGCCHTQHVLDLDTGATSGEI